MNTFQRFLVFIVVIFLFAVISIYIYQTIQKPCQTCSSSSKFMPTCTSEEVVYQNIQKEDLQKMKEMGGYHSGSDISESDDESSELDE